MTHPPSNAVDGRLSQLYGQSGCTSTITAKTSRSNDAYPAGVPGDTPTGRKRYRYENPSILYRGDFVCRRPVSRAGGTPRRPAVSRVLTTSDVGREIYAAKIKQMPPGRGSAKKQTEKRQKPLPGGRRRLCANEQ